MNRFALTFLFLCSLSLVLLPATWGLAEDYLSRSVMPAGHPYQFVPAYGHASSNPGSPRFFVPGYGYAIPGFGYDRAVVHSDALISQPWASRSIFENRVLAPSVPYFTQELFPTWKNRSAWSW